MNYIKSNIVEKIYESVNNKPLPDSTNPATDYLYSLSPDAPQELWSRVPILNSQYKLPKWGVEVAKLLSSKFPIYLYGPSGTGKSTLVRWISSVFSLPLYEITAHGRLESVDLIGSYQLKDGKTFWQDGPLTLAMRHGGVFLINEVSLLDPSTTTGLNTILDGQPLVITETSEVIVPHDAFYFIATDNTNGQAEELIFSGTLIQNQAFMGRFLLKEASYIERDQEALILKAYAPALPDASIDQMIAYASHTRAATINSQSPLTNPMTPRDCIKWAKLITLYTPLAKQLFKAGRNVLEYTLQIAYLNRLNKGDKLIAEELWHAIFGG